MRNITKQAEPAELTRWKRKNPGKSYADLSAKERQIVRMACLKEQHYLCAFCCRPVKLEQGRNAHLRSQFKFPVEALNWSNIVASCDTADTCDTFQKRAELPLTPLMKECETELRFYQSGKVEGLTPRAKKTIAALNLNCPSLRQRRARAIKDFLYDGEYFPPEEDVAQWDMELWADIINTCCRPDTQGRLAPYAPVLENIGRQFLAA